MFEDVEFHGDIEKYFYHYFPYRDHEGAGI
jgi:hypothetical protein